MLLEIFIISFIVALTGALSPGPVTTFTIYKSFQKNRGYLAGLFITLGHATLELSLILLLLFGAYIFFQNLLFLIIIGIMGGIFLVIFGMIIIKNALKKKAFIDFSITEENIEGYKGNSFLGGIIISISNPYWIIWWAVIGLSLMINFGLTDFNNPIGLILFFLGHELGDLLVLWGISIFTYYGGRSLNQ
ncbi:MAG: LysE family transporter, partial [Promethearchaeota archaeon]